MCANRKYLTRTTIAVIAILAGLLVPANANAYSHFKRFPSTVWGNLYAGDGGGKHLSETTFAGAHLDAKSTFQVTYSNFPEWAKKEVQAAIDVWSKYYVSKVPIHVEASWIRPRDSRILGSAMPVDYFAGFPGAPDATLWYPSALANALAGTDLDTRNPEIVIQVNSTKNWDQRGDGEPTTTEFDLQSVFIHEICHGLGFLSTDSYDTYPLSQTYRQGKIVRPTAFDAYAQMPDGTRLADMPSPSYELGKAMTNTLVWSGPNGIKANGGVKPLLYSPSEYDGGSSVSHLDEDTFSSSGKDSVMTPSLNAGEAFRDPGPLALAMMDDLRQKPPVGIAIALPQNPQNQAALVGDKSAVITFDPPPNLRAAQISSYIIKNIKTGQTTNAVESPVLISGLKNGQNYTFTVAAKNSLGISDAVPTNVVIPQASWTPTIFDPTADGLHVVSTNFRGQPAIVYTDIVKGILKLALWNGKTWKKITVDGRGGSGGKTTHDVSGPMSACVGGIGSSQVLHIFYTDVEDNDLRYASFDNTDFSFEIVDGNGPTVLSYEQQNRVRSANNVSISNACAVTAAGVQVFYRDESQGILLGAVKPQSAQKGQWVYEVVDGDRTTDNRTTGDVGFHLKAVAVGSDISVLYDSAIGPIVQKVIAQGEIRLATRTSISKSAWKYATLDKSDSATAVVGYEISLNKTLAGVIAGWLSSSPTTTPKPNQLRWANLNTPTTINVINPGNYGLPGSPMSVDYKSLAFGCGTRICSADLNTTTQSPTIKLVTNSLRSGYLQSDWVTINKIRYMIASVDGKLSFLKP